MFLIEGIIETYLCGNLGFAFGEYPDVAMHLPHFSIFNDSLFIYLMLIPLRQIIIKTSEYIQSSSTPV